MFKISKPTGIVIAFIVYGSYFVIGGYIFSDYMVIFIGIAMILFFLFRLHVVVAKFVYNKVKKYINDEVKDEELGV
jgi:hypothetical protein